MYIHTLRGRNVCSPSYIAAHSEGVPRRCSDIVTITVINVNYNILFALTIRYDVAVIRGEKYLPSAKCKILLSRDVKTYLKNKTPSNEKIYSPSVRGKENYKFKNVPTS